LLPVQLQLPTTAALVQDGVMGTRIMSTPALPGNQLSHTKIGDLNTSHTAGIFYYFIFDKLYCLLW
jgi:hypothetical protein